MPPFPQTEAARMVEVALGRPIDVALRPISASPSRPPRSPRSTRRACAAATRERIVAVKVVRPGVREQFARDLQAMRVRRPPRSSTSCRDARRLRPQEVVETLARSVAIEMDLRLEAAALSELAENTQGRHRASACRVRNGT